MNNEDELIERARKGSPEAFTELVRLHQGRVRAFLGQYFRNADTVDDLAQDVFLAAFRNLASFQTGHSLAPWLLGIARNRALENLRSEARRKVRETRSWQALLAGWKSEELEQAGEAVDPTSEMQCLERCLKHLPEHSAQLVKEFYFEGRAATEIARSTGKKESGIRMTLLRIRQTLRECIEQHLVAEQK